MISYTGVSHSGGGVQTDVLEVQPLNLAPGCVTVVVDQFVRRRLVHVETERSYRHLMDNVNVCICMCVSVNNCLCGSVAKASDTQAVGHEFDPRPDH